MFLSLSVALTFAALPVMAGSLSGGPAVGISHSGGPSATGSSSHARTVSDTTASGSSKTEAGKMNAGSSHSESVYKGGSSMSGVKTPSPTGTYNKKVAEDAGDENEAISDSGDKQEKKTAASTTHANPKVVEYKWKGHELKSKKVVNRGASKTKSTK